MNQQEKQDKKRVSIEDFGKDHWSLMGYIGCRIDSNPVPDARNFGVLDSMNLRDKTRLHWNPTYGTRLSGFWTDEGVNVERQLPDHDDFDCLDDLEAAGVITRISQTEILKVAFTSEGLHIYSALTKHKASGKHYSKFQWPLVN